MKTASLFLLIVLISSCSLFDGFRKGSYSFDENGAAHTVNFVVPKGYDQIIKNDSADLHVEIYRYDDGELLYFAHSTRPGFTIRDIDTFIHVPKPMLDGIFYKAIDSSGYYWRETKFRNFVIGYREVDSERAWLFDSSLNSFQIKSLNKAGKPVF